MSHGYAYAAAPQAVTGAAQTRAGYRGKQTTQQLAKDQTLPAHQANLMYDKRIVRGSTYALSHRLASHVPGMPGATGPFAGKHGGAARRHAAAAASTGSTATYTTYETYPRVMTPPAVEGRVHTEVQTDNYLEDLRETNNKVEFATQTMPELDRPSQPLFKPLEPIFYPLSEAKSVALMTDADELFDFDLTVEPLLSTLCDRGMEDAMMEVLEEEEQKEIRRGVSAFHQVHSAAVQVMQDKEHREARLAEEVYARAEQERTYLTEKHTAASKAAARRAARDALQVVAESALARLDDAGFFYDATARQAVTEFLPALVEQVQRRADRVAAAAAETEQMVLSAVQQAVVAQSRARAELVKQAVDEAARLAKEEAEKALPPATVVARSTGSGAGDSGDGGSDSADSTGSSATAGDETASSSSSSSSDKVSTAPTVVDAASAASAAPVPVVDGRRARHDPSFVALAAAAALATSTGRGAGAAVPTTFLPQVGALGGGGAHSGSRPSTSTSATLMGLAGFTSGLERTRPVAAATPAALLREQQRGGSLALSSDAVRTTAGGGPSGGGGGDDSDDDGESRKPSGSGKRGDDTPPPKRVSDADPESLEAADAKAAEEGTDVLAKSDVDSRRSSARAPATSAEVTPADLIAAGLPSQAEDPQLLLLKSSMRALGFTPMWALAEHDGDSAGDDGDDSHEALFSPGHPRHAGVLVGGSADDDMSHVAAQFIARHPNASPADADFMQRLCADAPPATWAAIDAAASNLTLPLFAPSLLAGLAEGDTVTHVNGTRVTDPLAFRALVHAQLPGDVMTVSVIRSRDGRGDELHIEVGTCARDKTLTEIRRLRAQLGLSISAAALLTAPQDALSALAAVPRTCGFSLCDPTQSVAKARAAAVTQAASAPRADALLGGNGPAQDIGGLGLLTATSTVLSSSLDPMVVAALDAVASLPGVGLVVQASDAAAAAAADAAAAQADIEDADALLPGDIILSINEDPLLAVSPAALAEALAIAHAPAAGAPAPAPGAHNATAVSAAAPHMVLPGTELKMQVLRFPRERAGTVIVPSLPPAVMSQALEATAGGGAGALLAVKTLASGIRVLTVSVTVAAAPGTAAVAGPAGSPLRNVVGPEWIHARTRMAGQLIPETHIGALTLRAPRSQAHLNAAAETASAGDGAAPGSGEVEDADALLRLKAAGAVLGFAAVPLSQGSIDGQCREAAQMVERARVHRAQLRHAPTTEADASTVFSSGSPAGVLVSFVEPFGAAAQASLQTGDIITHLNETPLTTPEALASFVRSGCVAGDAVHLTVVRTLDGRLQELYLEATPAPLSPVSQKEIRALRKRAGLPVGETAWYDAPAAVQVLAALLPATGAELADSDGAVTVTALTASTAVASGLRVGDIIRKLGSYELRAASEVAAIVSAKRPGDGLILTVTRAGEDATVNLELSGRLDSATFPASALAAVAAAPPVLPVTAAAAKPNVLAQAFCLGRSSRTSGTQIAVDCEAVRALRRMIATAEARGATADDVDSADCHGEDIGAAGSVPTVADLEAILAGSDDSVVPADRAAVVLARLPRSLGIAMRPCSEGLAVVDVAAGSPACYAGIVPGDVITHLDDAQVASAAAFADSLQAQHEVGGAVALRLLRNSDARPEVVQAEIATTPGPLADAFPLLRIRELREMAGVPPAMLSLPPLLSAGAAAAKLQALVPSMGVKISPFLLPGIEGAVGIVIDKVKPQGVSDLAGLCEGDVIVSIGSFDLIAASDPLEAFRAHVKTLLPGDFVPVRLVSNEVAQETFRAAFSDGSAGSIAHTARALYLEVSCGAPGEALSLEAVRSLRALARLPAGDAAKRIAVRAAVAGAASLPDASVLSSVAGFGTHLTSDTWMPEDPQEAAFVVTRVLSAIPASLGALMVPVTLMGDGAHSAVSGLQIVLVSPFGGAAQAELTEGDVVLAINNVEVKSLSELNAALRFERLGSDVSVAVRKSSGTSSEVSVELCVETPAVFDPVRGSSVLPSSAGDSGRAGVSRRQSSAGPPAGVTEDDCAIVLSAPPQSVVRALLALLPDHDESAMRALLTPEHAVATLSVLTASVDVNVTVATTKLSPDGEEAADVDEDHEFEVLILADVPADSNAAAFGAQEGDVVLAVNGVEFLSLSGSGHAQQRSVSEEFAALLQAMTPGDPLVMDVQRAESGERVVLTLPTCALDESGQLVAAPTVSALRRLAGYVDMPHAAAAAATATAAAAAGVDEGAAANAVAAEAEARARALALLSHIASSDPLVSDAGVPLVDLDVLTANLLATARPVPPSDAARAMVIVDRLRPDLGMNVAQLDALSLAPLAFNAAVPAYGAVVRVTSTLRDGSAAAATIVPGDFICMISGRVIETTADYRAALRTLTPGVVAELEVRRGSDGRIDHVHVEPGCTQPAAYPLSRIRELRAAARLPVSSEPLMDAATARLTLRGLKVRLGMNVSLQSNSAASGGACLIVTKVYPQSNAATMGFQPGYALLAVVSTMGAEVPLRSDLHLVAILNSYAPGDTLVLRVIPLNGASPRLLSIELDAANASREFVRSTRFIAGLLPDERA